MRQFVWQIRQNLSNGFEETDTGYRDRHRRTDEPEYFGSRQFGKSFQQIFHPEFRHRPVALWFFVIRQASPDFHVKLSLNLYQ